MKMISKPFIFAISILCAIPSLPAAELRDVSQAKAPVYHHSFETAPEALKWGYFYEPTQGLNGTGALVNRRTNPADYGVTTFALPALNAEKTYTATVWVKDHNLTAEGNQKDIGGICLEFIKDGKYFSGVYPTNPPGKDGEWRQLSVKFSPKPGADKGSVSLYLRKGYTGELYFDDLNVSEDGDLSLAIVPVRPAMMTFFGRTGVLEYTVSPGKVAGAELRLQLRQNGLSRELTAPLTGKTVSFELNDLAVGEMEVTAQLVNVQRSEIFYMETFCYQVKDARAEIAGAVTLDRRGRALIDGKPFMPVGLFAASLDRNDIQKIRAGNFNTVLPYSSMGLNIAQKEGKLGQKLRDSLDILAANDLKIIFSLKDQYPGKNYAVSRLGNAETPLAVAEIAVNDLKDHPALLAWYVSDEDTRGEVPMIVKLRQMINRADPYHPTYTLTFRNSDFPYYSISGDITGVDNYPVETARSNSLQSLAEAMTAAKSGNVPVWAVPQAMHWGVYKAKTAEEFDRYVFPSEAQLRSMVILPAVMGAKGFIFYAYQDIGKADKFAPGSSEIEWPKLCRTAAMLRELEPYLMSAQPQTEPKILAAKQTRIAAFTADSGKTAILICGLGPGAGHAKFEVPAGKAWRSKFGLTKSLGNQLYEFNCNDIDSDILFEE